MNTNAENIALWDIFQFKSIPKPFKPRLNENDAFTLFYHADCRLLKSIKKLKSFHRISQRQELIRNHRYRKALARVHRNQRILLDTLFLIQSHELDEHLKVEKSGYRSVLAMEDHLELETTYSENIFFAAQALVKGHRIRGIEGYSQELIPTAVSLVQSMEEVREFIISACMRRCQVNQLVSKLDKLDYETVKLKVTVDKSMLNKLLHKFDQAWATFEQMICQTYHQAQQRQFTDDLDLFVVLLSESMLRAKSYYLITQEQVEDCDPSLIITLPRLALVMGLVHHPSLLPLVEKNAFKWFCNKQHLLTKIKHHLNLLAKYDNYQSLVEQLEQMLVNASENPMSKTPDDDEPLFCIVARNLHMQQLRSIYMDICQVVDDLPSSPHAKELCYALKKAFDMHATVKG